MFYFSLCLVSGNLTEPQVFPHAFGRRSVAR